MYIFETFIQPKWELWREMTILKTQVGARESGAEPGSRLEQGWEWEDPMWCLHFILFYLALSSRCHGGFNNFDFRKRNSLGSWVLSRWGGTNSSFLMGVWQWIQGPVTVLGAETEWPLSAGLQTRHRSRPPPTSGNILKGRLKDCESWERGRRAGKGCPLGLAQPVETACNESALYGACQSSVGEGLRVTTSLCWTITYWCVFGEGQPLGAPLRSPSFTVQTWTHEHRDSPC